MNIFIHSFLPLPTSYYKEGRAEYEKRLSRYCKIKHTIYKNEKQLTKVRDKLKQLPFAAGKDAIIEVTAGEEKSLMDSSTLASYIEEKGIQGFSNLHFLIGFTAANQDMEDTASLDLLASMDSLSISNMTIGTDLLSLILEEQIYRAYRIMKKEPYHK